MLTLDDIKRASAWALKRAVGTIYVRGYRQYVAVRGLGFVNAGPWKEKLRKRASKT